MVPLLSYHDGVCGDFRHSSDTEGSPSAFQCYTFQGRKQVLTGFLVQIHPELVKQAANGRWGVGEQRDCHSSEIQELLIYSRIRFQSHFLYNLNVFF